MDWFVAFMYGICEFRLSTTMRYEDLRMASAYDRGREWAHRLTLRRFEP